MKKKVKVTLWDDEWRILELHSGKYIENISIQPQKKWGPLLKRAIEKDWQVVQWEDLEGTCYQWEENHQSWVSFDKPPAHLTQKGCSALARST